MRYIRIAQYNPDNPVPIDNDTGSTVMFGNFAAARADFAAACAAVESCAAEIVVTLFGMLGNYPPHAVIQG